MEVFIFDVLIVLRIEFNWYEYSHSFSTIENNEYIERKSRMV